MKNIVIISIYDSCYGWSILIDGYAISREELEYPRHRFPKGLRELAKEVLNVCNWGHNTTSYYLSKFKDYDHIIECENGSITIIK